MNTIINITFQNWLKEYKPLRNKVRTKRGRANTPGRLPAKQLAFDSADYLFETYGPELAYVQTQPYARVWTLLDSDSSDELYLQNGIHFTNRLGYYVTKIPHDPKKIIQVI